MERARVNRGGSARALWFASILFLVSVSFFDHDVFEVEAFSLEYLPNYVEAFPVRICVRVCCDCFDYFDECAELFRSI